MRYSSWCERAPQPNYGFSPCDVTCGKREITPTRRNGVRFLGLSRLFGGWSLPARVSPWSVLTRVHDAELWPRTTPILVRCLVPFAVSCIVCVDVLLQKIGIRKSYQGVETWTRTTIGNEKQQTGKHGKTNKTQNRFRSGHFH